MNKTNELLILNLQNFAEEEEETPEGEGIIDEENPTDASQNTEEEVEVDNKIPYGRFKQKVDEANALKKKLAEFEEAEKNRKEQELADQNKYKELYELEKQKRKQHEIEIVETKKMTLLASAGYDDNQVAKLSKLVDGESDEEINASIEAIKEAFPTKPNYVDPSVDNSHRAKPASKDNDDLGRSLYARIKGLKK